MKISNDRPIYLQIADDVRAQILTGKLAPGDQLLSTTQYANQYRINPATANKAFNVLVEGFVVEKRRGIGMFVTADAPEILRNSGRSTYINDQLGPALDKGINLGLSHTEILSFASEYLAKCTTSHNSRPHPAPAKEQQ